MIVIRLNGNPAYHEANLREMDAMAAIPGCCDIVWLGSGGHPDISWHEKNAERFIELADYARSKGIIPMVELQGLGHGDSRSPSHTGADVFEKMTGPDGYVADGAYCPWGKNLQAYYTRYVGGYAKCRPAGLYIDDDLRMEFHGRVPFGCYCDDCIRRFNETWGTSFTREEIVRLIATDSLWRERYVEQNRQGMESFMRNVARSVHAVSPETQVGFEYVYLTQCLGSDWESVFRPIYEETGLPPLSRPGCFFYEDHEPRKMLDKILNTSYQNMVAPDYVVDRWPEIENTSHTVMGKSVQGTCVESSLNLAYGCNGLTYSMISSESEPLEERSRMWTAFARHRRYWQQLIDDLPGTGAGGVCIAQDPDAWKTVIPGDKGFDWCEVPHRGARKLVEIGLPLSYEKKFCKVSVLYPGVARTITEKALRVLLAGRVLTDAESVEILRERGFGASLPVEGHPGTARSEFYTDHPANRELAGCKGIVDGFTPGVRPWYLVCGEDCEPLAFASEAARGDAANHEPDEVIPAENRVVTSALVHTAEGGLWGVVGQSLWTVIVNCAHRRQITYLADYLAGGLPAYFETDDQAMLIPRVDAEGFCAACTVLNLTIGESQPYKLALRTRPGTPLVLCRPEYSDELLPVSYDGEGVAHVTLPPLAAWSTATVRPAKK